MVASIPACQRSPRRNQRCFCCSARLAEIVRAPATPPFVTPRACASSSFLAEKKPRVAASYLRRSPEASLMLLQSRYPGRRIGRIARENLVATHDTVFHPVNPHQPIKLCWALCAFPCE